MTVLRTLTVAATLAALAVVTACSGPSGTGSPGEPGDDPAVSGPALDLDCAGLLDAGVLDVAFGADIPPAPLTFDGAGSYYTLSQIGLARAGALRCEWTDRGANGTERYVTMSVLPGAADTWAAQSAAVGIYQPIANTYGDASWHTCNDSNGYTSCRIDVLSGDRWVSAVLAGLTGVDAAPAVIEAALTAVETAADRAVPVPSSAPSCDALAPVDVVGSVLGGIVARVELETPVQPVIYHAGFLQAGGTFCSWRNDLGSASALTADLAVLPGGATAWDDYWAIEPGSRVARETVADLGDAAYAGCVADIHCFAAVRTGDDWFEVTVNDEAVPDERDRAIALARAVLESW